MEEYKMNKEGISPEPPEDSENKQFSELNFEGGWRDILEAPDAADYQHQFNELIELTQQNVDEDWARDPKEVQRRWQVLIEQIAFSAITEDDLRVMSPSEIVETALITLATHLEEIGWIERGRSLEVVDLATGEPMYLDISEV